MSRKPTASVTPLGQGCLHNLSVKSVLFIAPLPWQRHVTYRVDRQRKRSIGNCRRSRVAACPRCETVAPTELLFFHSNFWSRHGLGFCLKRVHRNSLDQKSESRAGDFDLANFVDIGLPESQWDTDEEIVCPVSFECQIIKSIPIGNSRLGLAFEII